MDTKELMNNCSRARIITVKRILFLGFCDQNVTVSRRFSHLESTVNCAMLKQAMDVGIQTFLVPKMTCAIVCCASFQDNCNQQYPEADLSDACGDLFHSMLGLFTNGM